MPSKSKPNVTTDHEEIRRWVKQRGGQPAAVKSSRGSRGRGDRTGILRIDFPGYSGAGSLEEISWKNSSKISQGEAGVSLSGANGRRSEKQFQQARAA